MTFNLCYTTETDMKKVIQDERGGVQRMDMYTPCFLIQLKFHIPSPKVSLLLLTSSSSRLLPLDSTPVKSLKQTCFIFFLFLFFFYYQSSSSFLLILCRILNRRLEDDAFRMQNCKKKKKVGMYVNVRLSNSGSHSASGAIAVTTMRISQTQLLDFP